MSWAASAWRVAAARAGAACQTFVKVQQMRSVGGVLLCTAVVSIPLGFVSGFLAWTPVTNIPTILKGALLGIVSPCLVEELLFRAILLPHPAIDGYMSPIKYAGKAVIPLGCFVAYHLLNPIERHRKVFWDWRFLSLAAVLGSGCTASYYVTHGSLLSAVIAHWFPSMVWIFYLGGWQKLYQ